MNIRANEYRSVERSCTRMEQLNSRETSKRKHVEFMSRNSKGSYAQCLSYACSMPADSVEVEIESRIAELREFQGKNQNAITSPLLTKALVRKTEVTLSSNRSFSPIQSKFKRYAVFVKVCCIIRDCFTQTDTKILNRRIGDINSILKYSIKTVPRKIPISDSLREILTNDNTPRTGKDLQRIKYFLQNVNYLQVFPVDNLDILTSRIRLDVYQTGRVLCKQGHRSNCYYMVLEGQLLKLETKTYVEDVHEFHSELVAEGFHTNINESIGATHRDYSLFVRSRSSLILTLERDDLLEIFNVCTVDRTLQNTCRWMRESLVQHLCRHHAIATKVYECNEVVIDSTDERLAILETGACRVMRGKKRLVRELTRGQIFGLKFMRERVIRKVQSMIRDRIVTQEDNGVHNLLEREVLISKVSRVILVKKSAFLKYADFQTLVDIFKLEIEI